MLLLLGDSNNVYNTDWIMVKYILYYGSLHQA